MLNCLRKEPNLNPPEFIDIRAHGVKDRYGITRKIGAAHYEIMLQSNNANKLNSSANLNLLPGPRKHNLTSETALLFGGFLTLF